VSGSPEEDWGGILRWHNDCGTTAQRQQRGRGGKGQLIGRGAPFKGCMRKWRRAAETVGGKGEREWWQNWWEKPWAEKAAATAECGQHGSAVVPTGLLTSSAHAVLYFSEIIQTGSKMEIENGCLTLLQKFPIFCMLLDWHIMNNFLNCAGIQFSI
jgi:hypothetical protein